jgi:hypothetical protein
MYHFFISYHISTPIGIEKAPITPRFTSKSLLQQKDGEGRRGRLGVYSENGAAVRFLCGR